MRSKNEKNTEFNKKTPIPFFLELSRSGKNSDIVVGGVIGVLEFSDENALLSTYSGRINISGEKLNVTIFENKTVQIQGKIKEIGLD